MVDEPGGFVMIEEEAKPQPIRIQRKRTKGWKMPENTISVCRPGSWGNPFIVGKPIPKAWLHFEFASSDTSLYLGGAVITGPDEAVRLYKKYIVPRPCDLQAIRGKNLACWCALGQPCHADVLLELANGPPHLPSTL